MWLLHLCLTLGWASDALEAAQTAVRAAPAGSVAQAEALTALAELQEDELGWEAARSTLEELAELRAALHGPGDLRVCEALFDAAHYAWFDLDLPATAAWGERAVASCRAAKGADDHDTAWAMALLGAALADAGELSRAMALFDEAEAVFTAEQDAWFIAWNTARRGLALVANERWAEAEPVLELALERTLAVQGQEMQTTVDVRIGLATTLQATDRPLRTREVLAPQVSDPHLKVQLLARRLELAPLPEEGEVVCGLAGQAVEAAIDAWGLESSWTGVMVSNSLVACARAGELQAGQELAAGVLDTLRATGEPLALGRMLARVGKVLADAEAPEAEATLQEAVSVLEQALGPAHPELFKPLVELFGEVQTRSPREAGPLADRVLEMEAAGQFRDEADAAWGLSLAAEQASLTGSSTEALALAERAIDRFRRLGIGGERLARTVYAEALMDLGRLEEAEAELVALLGAGLDDDEKASVLLIRSRVAGARRDLESEVAHLEEAVRLASGALPPDHPYLGHLVGVHARTLARLELPGALEATETALERFSALLERGDPIYAAVLHSYGLLLREEGRLAEAEVALRRAIPLLTVAHGAQSEQVVLSEHALAVVLHYRGANEEAGRLARRALSNARDPRHRPGSLVLLSALAAEEGDLSRAAELSEEALALLRAGDDPDPVMLADALGSRAVLLTTQGDAERSLALTRESVSVLAAHWGEEHRQTTEARLNLVGVLRFAGHDREARMLLDEVLARLEASLPPEHPLLGIAWTRGGRLAGDMGDTMRGVVLLERALANHLARDDIGWTAQTLVSLARNLRVRGELEPALERAERGVSLNRRRGPLRRDTRLALEELADVRQALGDLQGAKDAVDEALQTCEETLELASGLSEREALAFVSGCRSTLHRWLALALPSGGEPRVSPGLAFTRLRHIEGAVLLRLRQRADRRDTPQAQRLDEVRTALARAALGGEAGEEVLLGLREEKEQLERLLGRASASLSEVDTASLCEALPPGTALVDVVRDARSRPARYGAFVLRRECQVHWRDLGEAALLDAAIDDWRRVLSAPSTSAAMVARRGREVTERFWRPLAPLVGDDDLWVVPDGRLATIPLGALPIAGGFLVEERQVSLLDHPDDLVRRASQGTGRGALLAGAVDFGPAGDLAALAARTCSPEPFPPLPGTATELEAVARSWPRRLRREPVEVLRGTDATAEAVAEGLGGRRLVHLATHGFFGACDEVQGSAVATNPLLRSGLAWAGANAGDGRGLLTAEQLLATELAGTDLVVLSACETGLGELHDGEGVRGLRRAFAVAGVGAVVMSLWSVPDAATAALMADFYRGLLHKRLSPGAALRRAQLARLATARAQGEPRPQDWAAFVVSGRQAQ